MGEYTVRLINSRLDTIFEEMNEFEDIMANTQLEYEKASKVVNQLIEEKSELEEILRRLGDE